LFLDCSSALHVVFARRHSRLFAAILRSLWQHFGSKANDSPENTSQTAAAFAQREKRGGVGMGKTAGWLEKIISSRNNKGNAENALAPLHSHFPPAVCRLSLPAFAPLTGNFRRLGLRPSTSFEPPATHSTPT